ncbi:MAG: hypothetical protein J0L96_03975 [Anaerolineae bacterium]|nr:hypothetical protein [Anaerolineae bacterium]
MLEKIIIRFAENISLRLITIGFIVAMVIGIPTCWEGASYLSLLIDAPFASTFWGLLIFGVTGSLGTSFLVIYPIERWFIRDKAKNSWKWVVIRLICFLLTSFPTSLGTLFTVRTGMQQYPAIVESIYFVQAVTATFMGSLLLTLAEQIIKIIQKRENKLKAEIVELRIEIDHIKRQKQVAEITDSDFFQNLKQKAEVMRKEKNVPNALSNVSS